MFIGRSLKYCGTPKLTTSRTFLRKLTLNDVYDLYKYAKNPQVSKYLIWDEHKSILESYNFIKWTINKYKKDEAGEWGIELKDTGRLIGTIGFASLDINNACGNIGYVLSKDFWGKGIMTEVVRRIIKFGFEHMNLNRIEAVHMMENEASGKVMKKSGMIFEGVLRERIYSNGEYMDVKQYAILKKDYVK